MAPPPDDSRPVNPSGVDGSGIPRRDDSPSDRAMREVDAIYRVASEQINRDVAAALRKMADDPDRQRGSFAAARGVQLQREIAQRLAVADRRIRPVAQRLTEETARKGAAATLAEARALGVDLTADRRADGTVGINDRSVLRIAEDTTAFITGSLQSAAADYGASAVRLFRGLAESPISAAEPAVNRAVAQAIITGDRVEALREVRRAFGGQIPGALDDSFKKLGNRQVQVGGWTGPLRTYAETVFRTRSGEAAQLARHEAAADVSASIGQPTYFQISGRVSRYFCTRAIGLVYTLSPSAEDPPFVVSVGSLPTGAPPPFHPRCSKRGSLYIVGLVSPGRVRDAGKAKTAFDRAARSGNLLEDVGA